jgi:hypothetical protein
MSTTLRSVSSIFSSASSADALAPVSTCTPPSVCHCAPDASYFGCSGSLTALLPNCSAL